MSSKSNYAGKTRYAYGGGVVDHGTRLGWWNRNIFPSDITDVTVKITPKYHKRPDLIAFDVYGTTTLMWLVLQYNNILSVDELEEGGVITLPSKTRAFTEILRSRSKTLT